MNLKTLILFMASLGIGQCADKLPETTVDHLPKVIMTKILWEHCDETTRKTSKLVSKKFLAAYNAMFPITRFLTEQSFMKHSFQAKDRGMLKQWLARGKDEKAILIFLDVNPMNCLVVETKIPLTKKVIDKILSLPKLHTLDLGVWGGAMNMSTSNHPIEYLLKKLPGNKTLKKLILHYDNVASITKALKKKPALESLSLIYIAPWGVTMGQNIYDLIYLNHKALTHLTILADSWGDFAWSDFAQALRSNTTLMNLTLIAIYGNKREAQRSLDYAKKVNWHLKIDYIDNVHSFRKIWLG